MAYVMKMDRTIPLWDREDPRNQVVSEIVDKSKKLVVGISRGSWEQNDRGTWKYFYTVYDIQGNVLLKTERKKDVREEALYAGKPTTPLTNLVHRLTSVAPFNLDPK